MDDSMCDAPIAILSGEDGSQGSSMVSSPWSRVVWAEDPPRVPKSAFVSWLCLAGCAVLCWLHHGSVAAQAVAPALWLCQVQAGTKAKANRIPGGPRNGYHSVPPRPWDSPWPQDSPWPLALLSLWRLAAAEHSSVLPRGPWPQIRRGTELGVGPVGAGCQARGEQPCRVRPGGHSAWSCASRP